MRRLLDEAVRDRVCPAAVIEVGSHRGPLWSTAVGTLQYEPSPPVDEHTVFDLASLTKPLVTGTLAMRQVEAGRLGLDHPVRRWVPAWTGADRATVTIADLLSHAAGLTAWLPLFRDHVGARDFEQAIAMLPLECPPRTRAIYSDLGFILLGFILERVAGRSLAEQAATLFAQLETDDLAFCPPSSWRARTAPTEFDAWRGRLVQGEVHDENCWALGGVAGHAGVFGTAPALGRFAREALAGTREARDRPHLGLSPATWRRFVSRTGVPTGSSRALAWDTMLPTSSCGTRLSSTAFGHTGFTGTSLWIDDVADVYVVFLTNRVYPTRAHNALRALRPGIHDAVMDAVRS